MWKYLGNWFSKEDQEQLTEKIFLFLSIILLPNSSCRMLSIIIVKYRAEKEFIACLKSLRATKLHTKLSSSIIMP